jgi:glyoxylase-like metal-dependent hydrolase (beta-lactamase superfamily II)
MSISTALAQQPAPPAGAGPGGGRGGAQNAVQAIVSVKPCLYLVAGAGANSVIRVTNDGIVVVDTKNIGDANYNALMAQIRTVSDKPVKFVVIGDVHQDKSGNTAQFIAAGAQVIAHENEKKGLETYTSPAGTPAAPNVSYKADYSIKLGGAEVARVYHFGAASTGGTPSLTFPI